MEKRKIWKILTMVFLAAGILLIGIGTAFPSEQDVTGKLIKGLSPSTIGKHDLSPNSYVQMLDLDPRDIDQLQDSMNAGAKIGEYPGACLAQGVVNSRDKLLGINTYIKTVGTAQNILFVGIMTSLGDPTKSSSYAKLSVLLPGSLPSSWVWMGFDFSSSPLNIPKGQEFWIVMFSSEDVQDGSYRLWGASTQNPYPKDIRIYDFNSNKWVIPPETIDVCFATYTPNPLPPPECSPDGCTKCVGYDLYTCVSGKWALTEKNSKQCGYTPPPPPPPPECSPDGCTKCVGYDLYTCVSGKWALTESNSKQCGYTPPPEDKFVEGSGFTYNWVNSCDDHGDPQTTFNLGETVYAYCKLTDVKSGDKVKFEWRYGADEIRHTSDVTLIQGGDICIWDKWSPDLAGNWYVKVWINGYSVWWYRIPPRQITVQQPVEPPGLTIDVSYSVEMQIAGTFNLLGAAVSFLFYRRF